MSEMAKPTAMHIPIHTNRAVRKFLPSLCIVFMANITNLISKLILKLAVYFVLHCVAIS
jgi:hypothetical protein